MVKNYVAILFSVLYIIFSIWRKKNNSMTKKGWFYLFFFSIFLIIVVVLTLLGITLDQFFK